MRDSIVLRERGYKKIAEIAPEREKKRVNASNRRTAVRKNAVERLRSVDPAQPSAARALEPAAPEVFCSAAHDEELHDVIGFWSELKLDIIEKYLPAYTTILTRQNPTFRTVYIDALAGSGTHISKATREEIAGSPARALGTRPPFSELHFIDIKGRKIDALERLAAEHPNVTVHSGDCNQVLLREVFPRCRYEDYARAVCLLDPYGLQLDWSVIETAGKMGSVEIFLNFPIMDINRNALARDESKERPKREALTRFWGEKSWKDAGYSNQPTLFGSEMVKATNDQFVKAFSDRLKKVAGFKFVAAPLAMKNRNRAVLYYLLFASPNETGRKIVNEIYQRYRAKGYG